MNLAERIDQQFPRDPGERRRVHAAVRLADDLWFVVFELRFPSVGGSWFPAFLREDSAGLETLSALPPTLDGMLDHPAAVGGLAPRAFYVSADFRQVKVDYVGDLDSDREWGRIEKRRIRYSLAEPLGAVEAEDLRINRTDPRPDAWLPPVEDAVPVAPVLFP